MNDLSKLSDEELKALYNQSSTPTSKEMSPPQSGGDIAAMSDDELKALYQGIQAQQTPQQPAMPGSRGNPAAAIVSGIANAGANAFEGGVDAVTWLGEKLGVISPKIAEQMKKDVHADAERWFRSSDETPSGDVFNESRMKYPALSAIPQAVTEIGLLSKMNPTTSLAGKAGKAANLALQSGTGALVGAGLAGGDTQNQDAAAMFGAAIPPTIQALGAGVKAGAGSLAKKFGMIDELQNMVKDVNQDLMMNKALDTTDRAAQAIKNTTDAARKIEANNYNQIKAIPGTIETKDVSSNLAKISLNRLDDKQANAISDLIKRVDNLNTMEDAIKLKQSLGKQFKNFSVGNTTETISNDYKTIINQVDDAIASKANEFGLTDAWKKANQYHRDIMIPLSNGNAFNIADAYADRELNPEIYKDAIKGFIKDAQKDTREFKAALKVMGGKDGPGSKIIQQDIIKSIFDDVVTTPQAFNKNVAFRKLNKAINKFESVLSDDSINALKGAKIILEKAGVTGEKQSIGGSIVKEASERLIGAAAGGVAGSVLGPSGAIAGSIAGTVFAKRLGNFVNSLMSTPNGLAILRGIGSGQKWSPRVLNLIKAGALEAAGSASNPNNALNQPLTPEQ